MSKIKQVKIPLTIYEDEIINVLECEGCKHYVNDYINLNDLPEVCKSCARFWDDNYEKLQ